MNEKQTQSDAVPPSPPMVRCARSVATFLERVIQQQTGYAVNLGTADRLRSIAFHLDEAAKIKPVLDAASAVVLKSKCSCGGCDICTLGLALMECYTGYPEPRPPVDTRRVAATPHAPTQETAPQ